MKHTNIQTANMVIESLNQRLINNLICIFHPSHDKWSRDQRIDKSKYEISMSSIYINALCPIDECCSLLMQSTQEEACAWSVTPDNLPCVIIRLVNKPCGRIWGFKAISVCFISESEILLELESFVSPFQTIMEIIQLL